MKQETDLLYCIQCKDLDTGKTGSFAYHKQAPFRAVSPVFDNVSELFVWFKVHGYETGHIGDVAVYEKVIA